MLGKRQQHTYAEYASRCDDVKRLQAFACRGLTWLVYTVVVCMVDLGHWGWVGEIIQKPDHVTEASLV